MRPIDIHAVVGSEEVLRFTIERVVLRSDWLSCPGTRRR